MPPASMAKMMTTNVAFELIKRGELALEQDVHGAARDLAAMAWARRRARPCSCRRASRSASRTCSHGIVTLSGNDASVVLAECIAGTEEAFVDADERAIAKRLGLTNSHFGNSNGWPDEGRTYVTARDLATLAAGRRSATIPSSTSNSTASASFTWGKTLGSGAADHPGQPQSACSAASPAPTASRPAIPTRPATASPARPSRTAAGWSWSSPGSTASTSGSRNRCG